LGLFCGMGLRRIRDPVSIDNFKGGFLVRMVGGGGGIYPRHVGGVCVLVLGSL